MSEKSWQAMLEEALEKAGEVAAVTERSRCLEIVKAEHGRAKPGSPVWACTLYLMYAIRHAEGEGGIQ